MGKVRCLKNLLNMWSIRNFAIFCEYTTGICMFTRETYSLKLDVVHKSTTLLVSYLSSRLLLSLLFCYYHYYYYYYISHYQTIVHIRSRTARDTPQLVLQHSQPSITMNQFGSCRCQPSWPSVSAAV